MDNLYALEDPLVKAMVIIALLGLIITIYRGPVWLRSLKTMRWFTAPNRTIALFFALGLFLGLLASSRYSIVSVSSADSVTLVKCDRLTGHMWIASGRPGNPEDFYFLRR